MISAQAQQLVDRLLGLRDEFYPGLEPHLNWTLLGRHQTDEVAYATINTLGGIAREDHSSVVAHDHELLTCAPHSLLLSFGILYGEDLLSVSSRTIWVPLVPPAAPPRALGDDWLFLPTMNDEQVAHYTGKLDSFDWGAGD